MPLVFDDLHSIVGREAFAHPLALGRHRPQDPPPPDRECCARGQLLIKPSADPQGEWFGDVSCVDCAPCADSRGNSSEIHRPSLAVLMLGHRRRLLLDTVLEHVIGAGVQEGHPATLFAYLENSTMATP